MNPAELTPLTARPGGPVQGRARVPGDKSISHRALILGALTVGETTIGGLLRQSTASRGSTVTPSSWCSGTRASQAISRKGAPRKRRCRPCTSYASGCRRRRSRPSVILAARRFSHPNYQAEQALAAPVRQELLRDLD